MADRRSRALVGGAFLVTFLFASGCGGGASSGGAISGGGGAARPAGGSPAATAAPVSGGGGGPDAAPAGGQDGGQGGGEGGGQGGGDQASLPQGSLVVRTGTLQLEVSDLDATTVKARGIVVGAGGFIAGSDESRQGEEQVASITYRIPADRWDDVLTGLRGLARTVIGEQTNAQEVTGEVVDLGARIENLQASESAVQGIMARAQRIEDVLTVQNQLTSIRGEIERLEAQRAHLQDQAAFGTLTVTYTLPVPVVAVTEAREGWDPARELDRAAAQTVQLGQGLATFLIWFGVVGVPFLLTLGVIVGIVVLTARRLNRRAIAREPLAGSGS